MRTFDLWHLDLVENNIPVLHSLRPEWWQNFTWNSIILFGNYLSSLNTCMRHHFFCTTYQWFLQNLRKDFIWTNMHTTVQEFKYAFNFGSHCALVRVEMTLLENIYSRSCSQGVTQKWRKMIFLSKLTLYSICVLHARSWTIIWSRSL